MVVCRLAASSSRPSDLISSVRPSRALMAFDSVVVIAGAAAVLAVIGSLSGLVEAASLVFLVAFGAVNVIAIRTGAGSRLIASVAVIVASLVGVILIYRLATTNPNPLAIIVSLMLASYFMRPWILRKVRSKIEGAPDGILSCRPFASGRGAS